MPKKTRLVKSWDDFSALLEKLDVLKGSRRFLYRGQPSSDPKWGLRPSLLRKLEDRGIAPGTARKLEVAGTRMFLQNMHRYLEPAETSMTQAPIGRWMLMQQYGAPTRLLDWSLSPYVALYFAVNDRPLDNGILWFFDHEAFNRAVYGLYEKTSLNLLVEEADDPQKAGPVPRTNYVLYGERTTERMFRQQGAFTVCSDILLDHAEAFRRLDEASGEKIALTKVEIQAQAKPRLLGNLLAMNVRGPSLFTGIKGLVTLVSDTVMSKLPEVKEKEDPKTK